MYMLFCVYIYQVYLPYMYCLQVECQSAEEALEACAAGADIVMLDNFTHETIPAAAKTVKDAYPHVLVEASGVSDRLRYSFY